MTSDNDKKAAEEYIALHYPMFNQGKYSGDTVEASRNAFLAGCEHKQKYFIKWLQTKNPMLGYLSPIDLIKLGKEERLFSFINEQLEQGQEK